MAVKYRSIKQNIQNIANIPAFLVVFSEMSLLCNDMRAATKKLRTRLTRRGSIGNCISLLQLITYFLGMIAFALVRKSDLKGYLFGIVAVAFGMVMPVLMWKEAEWVNLPLDSQR
jgi:hypothetical protein